MTVARGHVSVAGGQVGVGGGQVSVGGGAASLGVVQACVYAAVRSMRRAWLTSYSFYMSAQRPPSTKVAA